MLQQGAQLGSGSREAAVSTLQQTRELENLHERITSLNQRFYHLLNRFEAAMDRTEGVGTDDAASPERPVPAGHIHLLGEGIEDYARHLTHMEAQMERLERVA